MFSSIISAILALFQSIPIFDRWFTKSSATKQANAENDIKDQIDKIEKDGRP